MNYSGIIRSDFANGLGVRVTLFVSGCDLRCPGCHSSKLWDYENGAPFDDAKKEELLSYLRKDRVSGLTLSGGQPLAALNLPDVYALIKKVREEIPAKNIWLYTGYTLSPKDFSKTDDSLLCRTIALCDFVVDGEYDETKRDTTLAFRGSSNQRIIDVKRTLAFGQIMTLEID